MAMSERCKRLRKEGGRRFIVQMEIIAPFDASIADVRDYLWDLEWAGGCRNPQDDPMFSSVGVISATARLKK
jgi:hypothetical protein